MINVEHNALRLPAYAAVEVNSLTRANKFIERFMDAKRPRGLKVRHSPDLLTRTYYLEARGSEQLRYFIAALRAAGFVNRVTRRRVALQE